MARKVKNSKPLIILSGIIFLVFALIFHLFYSSGATMYDMNVLQRYEALVRDSLFSVRYSMKKNLDALEKSDEITVIQIDDKTTEELGKLSNSYWAARFPYNRQMNYLQKYFNPACVAYDVMFKSTKGKISTEEVRYDADLLGGLAKELFKYSQEFHEFPHKAIHKLGDFIGEMGDTLLNNTIQYVTVPDIGKPLPVICAYNLQESQQIYYEKQDFSSKDYYKWTFEQVLGDPEDPSEDISDIASLKEVAIPLENISGVPDNFVYLPGSDLITRDFISSVKLGYVTVRRDLDGTVRRYPLIHGTKYYNEVEKKLKTLYLPSFSLLSILKLKNKSPKDVKITFGESLKIGDDYTIPIDNYGRMLVNFNMRSFDFDNLPFYMINQYGEILSKNEQGALPDVQKGILKEIQRKLKDKIAMVGLTFTGNGDVGPTSLDDHMPLVYVHAAVANEILTKTHLVKASDGLMYSFIALIVVLLGFGGVSLSIKDLTVFFALIILLIGSVSFGGIYWNKVHFPVLFLCFFTLILYLSVVLLRYTTEEKEKMKIRNMFSTMVSSDVLNYMEENPESFSLSGSKMPCTIMFSDVAGFTSISEGLTPEKLVQLLNKYLTPMTDIILSSGGYVDKYEGDAIMAEWGVPYPDEKHATKACWAVLDQLKKLDEIREDLYEEFGYRLTVRLGLNSGDVSAGNMGSESRFSYTVMGDAVNLAARLEPTNKVYGTYAMLGEKTYDLAKDDIDARLLDKVVVVGKKEAIRVYELIARKNEMTEDQRKVVQHYEKGLELHEERLWDEAIAEFEAALKINPEDYASQVLIKRIEEYKVDPPAENWKGEYVRKSKD